MLLNKNVHHHFVLILQMIKKKLLEFNHQSLLLIKMLKKNQSHRKIRQRKKMLKKDQLFGKAFPSLVQRLLMIIYLKLMMKMIFLKMI